MKIRKAEKYLITILIVTEIVEKWMDLVKEVMYRIQY
mgnify:CR=1 FL=1